MRCDAIFCKERSCGLCSGPDSLGNSGLGVVLGVPSVGAIVTFRSASSVSSKWVASFLHKIQKVVSSICSHDLAGVSEGLTQL